MNGNLKLALVGLLLASLACTIPFLSGTSGSGDLITVEESISGFDRIEISHSFQVDIVQSLTFGVTVRVDDNVEQYLVIEQRGDTLVLGLEGGRSYSDVTLEAEISMPALRALELSGANNVTFAQFESADPFDLSSSGSNSINGEITAGDVTIRLSGDSDLRLTGSGQNLTIDASGSSRVDLEQFAVEDADLDLSGSSEVTVNVGGVLNVSASGSSDITYVGNPTLGDINTSGSSSVRGE